MWDDTSLYILEKRTEGRITVTSGTQNNFWSNSHKTFYDFCLPTAATAEKPSASVLVGTWVTSAVANLHFEANSIFDDIAVVGDQARYDNGQLLIEIVKDIQTAHSCPVVVGGDFNANLYSSPVGLELTMGSAAAGSAYKALVKYDTLDEAQKAEYTKDAYGYAYKLDAEENRVYLRAAEAATADKAGNFEAVRHIALDYVDSNTTHAIKAPEVGDTRYETVTSIAKDSKNAIDHVLYKGCGENTITFNQYKVVDDCFALTSSDHAPHYVDIVLN